MRDPVQQAAKEAYIKNTIAELLAEGKYSREYILSQVAARTFLTFNTVERIYWGQYDTRREAARKARI